MRENLTFTGLLRTKNFRDFERLGAISRDDVDDRDVVIFPEKIGGKYWMLHRPAEWVGPQHGTDKASIWITSSDKLTEWKNPSRLLAKPDADAPWQEKKIGASCPPIKTKHGWLLMYHGVQGVKPERYYRQGVMMLDLNDPQKVISRPRPFVLEPSESWEKVGVEENVVFAVGNVVVGDTYYCYYGGADKCIGVATCKFDDLVDFAMSAAR
ncbi:MAG: glycoside hydrolase family 130 protein [Elusimicrobiota bacterium]